jgi:molybdenum cofactor cytidylyltransferase
LLAAGNSTRLGTPKQLLNYKGNSLLQHISSIAVGANASPVIIVVGANANLLLPEIDQGKTHVVLNDHWQQGMASSIIAGLSFLLETNSSTDGVIFMMCDQPFVTVSLLNDLIMTQRQTGKPIVASSYDNIIGAPALFHKSIFPELLNLTGDTGARMIIQRHMTQVATVPFSKGKIDIDTAEDYEKLINSWGI